MPVVAIVISVATQLSAIAATPPIYLVVDSVPRHAPLPDKAGNRRIVIVRAFDDGDAGACARAQMRFPNSAGSSTASHCVRELPAEFAPILQNAPIAKAYLLKFTTPSTPGASYRLLFDMATIDPPQVCRNIVDYERRFGGLSPTTRIQCWVPKA